ncbi:MAG: hypothetical protein ACK58P_16615 [Betaproteobacteria bacterium]
MLIDTIKQQAGGRDLDSHAYAVRAAQHQAHGCVVDLHLAIQVDPVIETGARQRARRLGEQFAKRSFVRDLYHGADWANRTT